ncbi:septum formation family protein [Streptomyces sp. NPDC048270]|uniref:septum formation family protein n=1 Tax=Streptomyces sp. NPDC048270 TaxID=3154615 RepID=UPI0033C14ED7
MSRTLRGVSVLLLALTGALGYAPGAVADDIRDLRTGDCFTTDDDLKDYKEDGSGSASPEVTEVPCDQPHEGEVYATFSLPAGTYPGLEKISALASDKCTKTTALHDYVGGGELPKELRVFYYGPHSTGWVLGDRDITCFVGYEDRTSKGSFRSDSP